MEVLVRLAVLSVLISAVSTRASDGPVVQTMSGPVRGLDVPEGTVFLGVPFAAPPTGALRWKPPRPARPWKPTVYDATRRSPACLQEHKYGCGFGGFNDPMGVCSPDNNRSEDCLYLNIFAPHGAKSTTLRKPVIFFIHGGYFLYETAMGLLYDARVLANRTDAVVVAANYRLGAMGFLRAGQGEGAAMGNYGVLDQIAAMTWVQDNIGNFGGDENRVTIYGQEVGAISVLIHLVSSSSEKLFHQAIISSTPSGLYIKTEQDAIAYGDHFAKALNCTPGNMTCLRAANESSVLEAQYKEQHFDLSNFTLTEVFEPWAPFIDGHVITGQLIDSIAAGRFQKKPLMVGTNPADASMLVYNSFQTPLTEKDYEALVFGLFRLHTPAILNRYPPSHSGDERGTFSALTSNFLFTCATRYTVRKASAEGDPQMWMYVLEHPLAYKQFWPKDFVHCKSNVCEISDLILLFQSMSVKGYHYSSEEQVLGDSMARYIGNFVHSGDPNKPGKDCMKHEGWSTAEDPIHWPPYSPAGGYPSLMFNLPQNSLQEDYLKSTCDFWDSLHVYP